jgi:L-asparaginase II
MLDKAGLGVSALACGAHWPSAQAAAFALARTGVPSALHNNCRQACRLSLRRVHDGRRSCRLL